MASKFLVPDRDQSFLEEVSYHERLGADHVVWTFIDVVDRLDLSVVYSRYRPDTGGGGRPAFDPKMLLVLLMFGYSEGKRSSRQLEEACWRDMAYRAICGDLHPDHATIARFRGKIDDVLEGLFVEVLSVLVDAGMVDTSVVALDGTRMGAVASKEANRGRDALARLHVEARRILDEAARADTADGVNTTDVNDVNVDGATDDDDDGGVRGSSVSRKAMEQVRRAQRVDTAVGMVADAESGRAVYEAKRQKPFDPVVNVTDPESTLHKTRGGFIQGYNAQSVVSSDQVVIACDVTPDQADVDQFVPMLEQSKSNVAVAGVTTPIGVALADAGYGSATNFGAGDELGMCLLISTSKRRTVNDHARKAVARAERDRERIEVLSRITTGEITRIQAAGILGLSYSRTCTLYLRWVRTATLDSLETVAWQAMTDKLAIPANKTLYKQRSPKIEGSFAHIKTHRRIDAFTRHGVTACRAEWHLINIAGNINKLHKKLTTNRSKPGSDGSRHRFRPGFDTHNAVHRFTDRHLRNRTTIRPHHPHRWPTT